MPDCCPIAPFRPTPWDPHRQTEPVRLFYVLVTLPSGEQIGTVFPARAQEVDRKKREAGKRLGGHAGIDERVM